MNTELGIKEMRIDESYRNYYESKECYMVRESEVEFFKDEDGYNLWIDFLRVFPTLEEAKEHRIGLLKEVTKLGFEFEMKDVEVEVEVDHIEDAELYSILLDIPVFENIEDAYSWIYKAIELIHKLK